MAKKKFQITLSNCLIDHTEIQGKSIMVEEIGKDESNEIDLCSVLSEFTDVEGVTITISFNSDMKGDVE